MTPENSLNTPGQQQDWARRARRRRRRLCESLGGGMLVAAVVLGWGSVPGASLAYDARPSMAGKASSVEPALPGKKADDAVEKSASTSASASEKSSSESASGSAATPTETPAAKSTAGPRELSTQPLIDQPRVVIDRSKRPVWVEQPPVRTGELHTTTVSSGPFVTQRAALERLDEELQAAVSAYVEEYLESSEAGRKIVYSAKDIRQRLVKQPVYLEYGEFEGLGTMQDAHAQLVFDASFRAELEERWRQIRALSRLIQWSVVAGGFLVVLASVRWMLPKRDKNAQGSPASLKLTAGTAILGCLGAGALLAVKYLF